MKISLRERQLFENKEVLEKIKRGIADAAARRVHYLGGFSQYIDDAESTIINNQQCQKFAQ